MPALGFGSALGSEGALAAPAEGPTGDGVAASLESLATSLASCTSFAAELSFGADLAARRSSRCASWNANAARAATLLFISSRLEMRPAPGRSSSAISAPRGSDAMAAIEPVRGPRPKRLSASAASALESRAMRDRPLDSANTLLHHSKLSCRKRGDKSSLNYCNL